MGDNNKRFLRIPYFSLAENADFDESNSPRVVSFTEECSEAYKQIIENETLAVHPRNFADDTKTPKFNVVESFERHQTLKTDETFDPNIDEYFGGVGQINTVKDSLNKKTIIVSNLTSPKDPNDQSLNLSDSIDILTNDKTCSRSISCQCIIT